MSSDTPPPSLYAAREPVFPRRVSGVFRSLKWWIMGITLGIYYILPWIRWDRGPNMPDQAVLVDLASRRFFFFMIEIWPHEFYFVAGLLIMAGLGLFLFTSALGRVWCGYACPQTVWTDLFVLVERWIEGDRNARLRLHRQKWNAEKLRKRVVKWTAWALIGLATGGAWVFYFTDAPQLLRDLITFEAHPVAYATIGILTATTFVFGGFMREQICIYACPWPRIQAAMMDEDTITIAYRDWRGEPRGKLKKAAPTPASAAPALSLQGGEVRLAQGDCIDCMACVNVCPMGIDIREGQQLACITCGLCIDACNEVMDKVGKPRGLIDYLALTDETAERAGQPPKPYWRHVFRPRTMLYTALWAAVGVGLTVALFLRSDIDVNVTPVRNPLFVTLSDGSIRNSYDIRLRNMSHDARRFEITVDAPEGIRVEVEGEAEAGATVAPDATLLQRIYLIAPKGSAEAEGARTDVVFWFEAEDSHKRTKAETVFHGKGN